MKKLNLFKEKTVAKKKDLINKFSNFESKYKSVAFLYTNNNL